VNGVNIHFSGGTSWLAAVNTDARVWFSVTSPSRSVLKWEPAPTQPAL
jgi:hypothetical protein